MNRILMMLALVVVVLLGFPATVHADGGCPAREAPPEGGSRCYLEASSICYERCGGIVNCEWDCDDLDGDCNPAVWCTGWGTPCSSDAQCNQSGQGGFCCTFFGCEPCYLHYNRDGDGESQALLPYGPAAWEALLRVPTEGC